MDATQPALPEKARFNYIEGYALLPVDPAQEFSNLDTGIAIRTYLSIQRCAARIGSFHSLRSQSSNLLPAKLDKFTTGCLAHKTHQWAQNQNQISRLDFSQAFDSLAELTTTSLLHASTNQFTA